MIYIIITTCIYPKFGIDGGETRANRYIQCIGHLLELLRGETDMKLIIVENSGVTESYLDRFDCDIVYTRNNEYSSPHKGKNELMDINAVISCYNIGDEDMIVKLTGRYKMMNKSFLEKVRAHSADYDAFVKFFNVCTLQYLEDDCVLGLIAIRRKYLTNFNYSLLRSPECEFATYVRKTLGDRVMAIDDLGLECQFADDLRILYV